MKLKVCVVCVHNSGPVAYTEVVIPAKIEGVSLPEDSDLKIINEMVKNNKDFREKVLSGLRADGTDLHELHDPNEWTNKCIVVGSDNDSSDVAAGLFDEILQNHYTNLD